MHYIFMNVFKVEMYVYFYKCLQGTNACIFYECLQGRNALYFYECLRGRKLVLIE